MAISEYTVYFNREGTTLSGTWETTCFLVIKTTDADTALRIAQRRKCLHEAGVRYSKDVPAAVKQMVMEEWSWRVYDDHGELLIR